MDKRVFEVLFADLESASRALLLSQIGAGASCALTVLLTGPDFVPSAEFRVLLLRRLRLALPLAPRRCSSCPRPPSWAKGPCLIRMRSSPMRAGTKAAASSAP